MTRPERLLSELHGYLSADVVEEGHRQRMVQLLTRAADVFSRAHFEPGHFNQRSPH